MTEIKLTLPYPISANVYWRSFVPKHQSRAVTIRSREANDYKALVAEKCRQAGITGPIAGRVEVAIRLYPQRPQDWEKRVRKNPDSWDDDVRCIDLDNANKVLFDAIKGIAIDDDKWIRRLTSERMEPDGEARVVMVIRPLQVDTPQASLI